MARGRASLTSRQADDDDSDQDARPRQRPGRNSSPDDVGDESGDGIDGSASRDADGQLAKKLVRYALACEYSRTPIRRDGIKERGNVAVGGGGGWRGQVLGSQGRSFKRVLAVAQRQLRQVWGMELRELPMREKMSLQEKRQGERHVATRAAGPALTAGQP